MRIAIFTDQFYPELSGVADCVVTSAVALASRGHDIDIFAPKYDRKDFSKSKLTEGEIDLDVNIHIHRMFSLRYPGSPTGQARLVIPSLFRTYLMRKQKPDVIHTHLFAGSGLQSIINSRLLHIPLIGTNHTRIQYYVPRLPFGQKTAVALARRFMSGFYNFCFFVSAPAAFLLSEMEENGLTVPHAVISNAIDTSIFTPAADKEVIRKKFQFAKTTLLYAGRLAQEKNIETVIHALKIVSDMGIEVELVLAGHGSHEDSLRALVHTLSLDSQVRFVGNLDKPELARYYQAADIYVTASPSEIQSLSLMQALSSGLPSISLHLENPPVYLKDSVNAFCIASDDSELFANKIQNLISDQQVYKKMSREAIGTAKEFSPEYIATQWEEMYQSYIEKSRTLRSRTKLIKR